MSVRRRHKEARGRRAVRRRGVQPARRRRLLPSSTAGMGSDRRRQPPTPRSPAHTLVKAPRLSGSSRLVSVEVVSLAFRVPEAVGDCITPKDVFDSADVTVLDLYEPMLAEVHRRHR